MVIDYLVIDAQTNFLKKRQLNEGFLYAQEVVTIATKERQQIALFKTDITKAFDTLSWEFLLNESSF
jgi:hypothetical protein